MNHFRTLSERQEATQKALTNEMDKLTKDGFNPFLKGSKVYYCRQEQRPVLKRRQLEIDVL